KAVLNFVADKCESPGVKIDRDVFNPARLIGAIGAEKKKGDPDFKERPHRISKIYSVGGEAFDPEKTQTVTPCHLLAIIEPLLPQEPEKERKPKTKTDSADKPRAALFDARTVAVKLENHKATDRGFDYYDCPCCGGNQTLWINAESGKAGCWRPTCEWRDVQA